MMDLTKSWYFLILKKKNLVLAVLGLMAACGRSSLGEQGSLLQ